MATRINYSRGRLRNRNKILPIILTLLVVSSFGSLLLLRPPPQKESTIDRVVAEYDTVKVFFTNADVPAGTKFADIQFKSIPFPRHQLLPGQITADNSGSFSDKVSVAPLPANFPVIADNFQSADLRTNPVIDRIPQGYRAMTVKVDATSAVEGWAGSGAIVDVLLVEKDRTSVVAEKVRILSAERSTSPVQGSAAPSVPSTVTLLVTQEQCLAINTAIPLGRIAFALRSAVDQEIWHDPIFTAQKLRGGVPAASTPEAIIGYATVKDRSGNPGKQFALTGNKWIKTEVVPDGFFSSNTSHPSENIAPDKDR